MVAVAIGGAAILGAGASIYSGNKAADAAEKAAAQSAALQKAQYEQTRADLGQYRDVGGNALSQLSKLYGFDGPDAQQAGFDQFRADPGYQYALNQGTQQVETSRAASGGLFSGGTLKAIQDRGMNLADQGYSNYLSRLRATAESGQNAAAQTGTFGANAAAGQGNALMAAGEAQAGAALNTGNTINNTLSQLAGTYGAYKGGAFGSTAAPAASSIRPLPNTYLPAVGR